MILSLKIRHEMIILFFSLSGNSILNLVHLSGLRRMTFPHSMERFAAFERLSQKAFVAQGGVPSLLSTIWGRDLSKNFIDRVLPNHRYYYNTTCLPQRCY